MGTVWSARDEGGDEIASSPAAWHVAFWLLLAMLSVSVWVVRADDNWIGFGAAITALGVVYHLIGRQAVETRDDRWITPYCILLAVCLGLASYFVAMAAFFLIIGIPQAVHLPRRIGRGIGWAVVVLGGVVLGSLGNQGFEVEAVITILPWVAVTLVVTIGMAITVDRIVHQSEQRARLIRELKQTRTRLADANHAAGVAAERERVAREIHDTLAQGFTSIVMLAQAARGDAGVDRQALELIEETARENLAEARGLVAEFTPVALNGSTLSDALERLGERFQRETGLRVDVHVAAAETALAEILPAHQVVLLRAAQEAVANIRKHARAERVVITLAADADEAAVRISDDGRGFDPSDDRGHGFGLAGMRGRVEESGGRLVLDSEPGGGTEVLVTMPRTAMRDAEVAP